VRRLLGGGTEPRRILLAGVLLAVLSLLFGVLAAWQVNSRSDAARDVVEHSAPLSADAAEIYRSLADADATAASGFLFAGQEPAKVRKTYEKDIDRAAKLLAHASAKSGDSTTAQRTIATINRGLPVYIGLVETARANNRQGRPVGGAYLRYASEQMRSKLLPAAEELYTAETKQVGTDRAAASAVPWLSYAAGVLALGAVVWFSLRLYRSTNRVFNVGLVAAGGAVFVLLAWLAIGQTVSRGSLEDSQEHGAASVQLLNESRIAALKARGDENLTLVARGNGDLYVADFDKWLKHLDTKGSGLMQRATAQAEDAGGRDPVAAAWKELRIWKGLHDKARKDDNSGEFNHALARTIGGEIDGKKVGKTTEKSFVAMDVKLAAAVRYEQKQFQEAAQGGRDALNGLLYGAGALCVFGAAAAIVGANRRVREYR
jgi:hypothetical protein